MIKIFLMLTLPLLIFSKDIYYYEDSIGNKKSVSKWTLNKKARGLIVKNKKNRLTLEYTNNFIINKYSFADQFTFFRKKNMLFVKGKINNKKIDKKYKISLPWIQQFSFGLNPFILSKKKIIKFYLLSPKDFVLHKMQAIKENIESLEIDGKIYKVQKVTIKLTGFKSLFWKAKAYFNIKNGDLLKYEGNSGPKTKTTTTILKKKEKI